MKITQLENRDKFEKSGAWSYSVKRKNFSICFIERALNTHF